MMSKKRKRIAAYIGMPLIFTVLGYLVLFIGGKPIVTMIEAHARMVITKGAPNYSNEYDPEISNLVMNQEGTFDVSEIQVPALETHYGNISCERIKLEAPIFYGDSDAVLQNGVGHYAGSGLPGEGKPILIGGHDSTYFSPLEQIKEGDIVHITTNYGQFEYKVTEIKVADAADTTAYDLSQSKEQLILYTCYPFGKLTGNRNDRYYVYCDQTLDSIQVTGSLEGEQ
jgi:sortase A